MREKAYIDIKIPAQLKATVETLLAELDMVESLPPKELRRLAVALEKILALIHLKLPV